MKLKEHRIPLLQKHLFRWPLPIFLSSILPDFSTQRLSVNLIAEHDHAFILELLNTEGWIQFIGNRNVHTKADAIAYIRKTKNTPDLFYWVVRLKEARTPLSARVHDRFILRWRNKEIYAFLPLDLKSFRHGV